MSDNDTKFIPGGINFGPQTWNPPVIASTTVPALAALTAAPRDAEVSRLTAALSEAQRERDALKGEVERLTEDRRRAGARADENLTALESMTRRALAAERARDEAQREVERVRADGMAHHEHIIDRYRRELDAAVTRAADFEEMAHVATRRAEAAERARDEAVAALRDAERSMRQIASSLQDPTKTMWQRCLLDLRCHDRDEHTFMREIVVAMKALDEACDRARRALAASTGEGSKP